MSRYALVADLAANAPAGVLSSISAPDQQTALDVASSRADSLLSAQYVLPLVAPFPACLVQAVCRIALWDLLSGKRGFNPEASSNETFRQNHDTDLAWLHSIAKGTASLPGVVDSNPTPAVRRGGARVTSSPRRVFPGGPCR